MDLIDREQAIEWIDNWRNINKYYHPHSKSKTIPMSEVIDILERVPSAQPQPLTYEEQQIFLAAMGREEEICKKFDDRCGDCKDPYEVSLIKICHEITRKVKGALWT